MKIALTGAATGIGAATAAKLKALGHEVTAFDISEPAGVDRWVTVDMSDLASISRALSQADGPYDVLINNAGLPPRDGWAEKILNVNFIGLRAFLDGMLDKLAPDASIVSTASRAGAQWRENIDDVRALMALETPDQIPAFVANREMNPTRAYNLSKEAVIAMTIGRTEEMIARGFRMTCVSPAAVDTAILDDFVTAFGDRARQGMARAGRAGNPDEIADLIVFLASPQSAWLKGQDITIDGGISAMVMADAMGLASPG